MTAFNLESGSAPRSSFALPYGERLSPLLEEPEACIAEKAELVPGARTAAVKLLWREILEYGGRR